MNDEVQFPIPEEDENGDIHGYPLTRAICLAMARHEWDALEDLLLDMKPHKMPPLVMVIILRNTFAARTRFKSWYAAVGKCRQACRDVYKMQPMQIDQIFRGLHTEERLLAASGEVLVLKRKRVDS